MENELGGVPKGIEEMLADHPGSAVTPEQQVTIDAHTAGSSESLVEKLVEEVKEHIHLWKRGILQGGVYVKTCSVGGEVVTIPFAEWQTISDR